uniref:Uncharacterized protein n=1 Tax=Ophiocordyceps sinensis TaxID=72228 RepID=A0A1W5T294_9HYPO|nr:hypothetical protein [Ophiocordyceps sinensis]ARF03359.1 hypothetical protein [Ophiocordyceps sinensis]QDH07215.1 hypothetical protein [Ophiocordyceps sinensis]
MLFILNNINNKIRKKTALRSKGRQAPASSEKNKNTIASLFNTNYRFFFYYTSLPSRGCAARKKLNIWINYKCFVGGVASSFFLLFYGCFYEDFVALRILRR